MIVLTTVAAIASARPFRSLHYGIDESGREYTLKDLRITMETVEKGKKQIAEMMVINGQWMLAKNVPRRGVRQSGVDQWSFELLAKHRETMRINGTWQKEAAPPTFSDDISLDCWQILNNRRE